MEKLAFSVWRSEKDLESDTRKLSFQELLVLKLSVKPAMEKVFSKWCALYGCQCKLISTSLHTLFNSVSVIISYLGTRVTNQMCPKLGHLSFCFKKGKQVCGHNVVWEAMETSFPLSWCTLTELLIWWKSHNTPILGCFCFAFLLWSPHPIGLFQACQAPSSDP